MDQKFDVIILGAGAAGLMCAIEAGKRGRRVLVLERADRIGRKILISGGGRCNFTNLHTTPDNFLSHNRHFAKSALARYQGAAVFPFSPSVVIAENRCWATGQRTRSSEPSLKHCGFAAILWLQDMC